MALFALLVYIIRLSIDFYSNLVQNIPKLLFVVGNLAERSGMIVARLPRLAGAIVKDVHIDIDIALAATVVTGVEVCLLYSCNHAIGVSRHRIPSSALGNDRVVSDFTDGADNVSNFKI
jgi:hypothetical protein